MASAGSRYLRYFRLANPALVRPKASPFIEGTLPQAKIVLGLASDISWFAQKLGWSQVIYLPESLATWRMGCPRK